MSVTVAKRRGDGALLARMTREIGEIGAGRRDPARPVSRDDGEIFSVRMVHEPADQAAFAEPHHALTR